MSRAALRTVFVVRLVRPGARGDPFQLPKQTPDHLALELGESLLTNGPTALTATKKIMRHEFDWSDEESW